MSGMSVKKIRIIIPYFGKWPLWIDLFLESCRFNPTVDWLIFTDCPMPGNRPENVAFESIAFEGYAQLLNKRLELGCD